LTWDISKHNRLSRGSVYLDLFKGPIQRVGSSIDLAGAKLSTSRDLAMGDTARGHIVKVRGTEELVSVGLALNRDCSPLLLLSYDLRIALLDSVSAVVRDIVRAFAVVRVTIDFALPHNSSVIITTARAVGSL
jgi:hypothetical protein